MTPYQQLLRDPRWQRRRLEIFARDQWQCQHCHAHDRELQVHHRWYMPGAAPWEVPDTALLTLCKDCHLEVGMPSGAPQIIKEGGIAAHDGRIPTVWTTAKQLYLHKAELIRQVALNHQKNADSIWFIYLRSHEGQAFLDEVKKDLSANGALNVEQLIEFADRNGTRWLLHRCALHFVAQYDHALENLIYRHFEETAIVFPAGQSQSPESNGLTMAKQLTQAVMLTIAEVEGVKATVALVEQHQAETSAIVHEHTRHIADLSAQIRLRPGRMSMREFVLTRLHRRTSTPQLKDWGVRLSRQCRWQDPQWDPAPIWDDLANIQVNTYAIEDLESFFRAEGLL